MRKEEISRGKISYTGGTCTLHAPSSIKRISIQCRHEMGGGGDSFKPSRLTDSPERSNLFYPYIVSLLSFVSRKKEFPATPADVS